MDKNDQKLRPLSYAMDIKTTSFKNVYQHMDHNSIIYYKHFWDMAAPFVYNLGLKSYKPASERFKLAQEFAKVDLIYGTPFKLEPVSEI